jgi:iron complex transport system substrate-binding protein
MNGRKGLAKLWICVLVIAVGLACFYGGYQIATSIIPTETGTAPPTTPPSSVEKVVIIDSAGRYVEINKPVKKVVVLDSDAATAVILLNATDVVVGVGDVVAQRPELYGELSNRTNVGKWSSPDYEKIIELKPELVLSYVKWPGSEAEEKLEPLGVKVVRLDFYIPQTMARELKTLGMILGREAEANTICQWIDNLSNLINDRLKDLKEENKVRTYLEQYSAWTVGGPGSGQYDLAIRAGLKPVGEFTTAYPKVTAEWVIDQNPDMVMKMITGSPLTLNITNYESVKNDIASRLGPTKAVRSGKIIILPGELAYKPSFPIAVLCVAKFAYPERFSDVDPEVYLRQYLAFRRLELKGVWWYPTNLGG